jgi:hypothetical protein
MAGHSKHGFVRYMLGVTYYSVLSMLFLNFSGINVKLKLSELKKIIKKEFGNVRNCTQNIAILLIVIVSALVLKDTVFHCETTKEEPWSSDISETINLGETSVTQQLVFTDINMIAYLKNISTVFVNLPNEDYSGKLRVEISDNGELVKSVDVSIDKAVAGEWFKIPIGCVIYENHVYDLTYSLVDADNFEPYIFTQDYTQASPSEEQLYLNGNENENSVLMKLEYDRVISNKLKLYMVMLLTIILLMIKMRLNYKRNDY